MYCEYTPLPLIGLPLVNPTHGLTEPDTYSTIVTVILYNVYGFAVY